MTGFFLKPGDRVRINTPGEPDFHGRVARIVERAPISDTWRTIFLDERPAKTKHLTYDYAFHQNELDLIVDRKRRASRRDEITGFARWLTCQGFALYGPDPAALFYVGRQPLREVQEGLGDLTDRYLREQGLD